MPVHLPWYRQIRPRLAAVDWRLFADLVPVLTVVIEMRSAQTLRLSAPALGIQSRRTVDPVGLYVGRVSVTLRSTSNVVFQCAFHVVWCPKYRRRVLGGRIEERLKQLICEIVEETGAWLAALGVMPDRIRLLAEVDPQYGVHKLVKAIKGRASRVLREEFPSLRSRLPNLWTNSCFVATTGGAPLAAVRWYVEQQKGR